MTQATKIKPSSVENNVKQCLAKTEKLDKESRYIARSLAYRLLNDYDKESEVVDTVRKSGCSTPYFEERAKWHALPKHQKMVPRRVLSFEKNPEWTPKLETIEQLCFVTIGGGKRVFRDMVESLESLRNTPSYQHCPVYVVDTGLTQYQKDFLQSRIKISQFYNPSDLFPQWAEKQQSWLSIAYFPNFFPWHRYYFHLECDTWIQDERSIDKHVKLCETQGWAMDGWNVGIYCIDSLSGFSEKWQNEIGSDCLIMEKVGNRLYHKHQLKQLKSLDQTSCPDFMHRHTKPAAPIGLINNNMVWHTGLPLIGDDDILVDPINLQPVGIFHVHKPCEYIRSLNFKIYSKPALSKLDEQSWKAHMEISREQLSIGPNASKSMTTEYNHITSMRYRTFPWRNNDALLKRLNQIVNSSSLGT